MSSPNIADIRRLANTMLRMEAENELRKEAEASPDHDWYRPFPNTRLQELLAIRPTLGPAEQVQLDAEAAQLHLTAEDQLARWRSRLVDRRAVEIRRECRKLSVNLHTINPTHPALPKAFRRWLLRGHRTGAFHNVHARTIAYLEIRQTVLHAFEFGTMPLEDLGRFVERQPAAVLAA